ncbi:MAG TPA: PilZ domain-containing protein [Thermodesulfovibrionales bacterium]|nr:PilZ domain-containing protein [Thermodesulfovibrionales bacterium]
MLNKRRDKRVPLAATAVIKYALEENAKPIQTWIADISLSGIGVYSNGPIREGAGLSIDVIFISAEGQKRTASLQGNTIYTREMGGMYFIGIEFDEEINPARQPALHERLRNILSCN